MNVTLAVALAAALAQADGPPSQVGSPENSPFKPPEKVTTASPPNPANDKPQTAPVEHRATGEANPPAGTIADVRPWYLRFNPFGYARVGVFYTFPFRDEQLVGGNGGFRLAALRMGVEFNPIDDLSVVASLELAAPVRNELDPTSGVRVVELRDGYIEYRLMKFLQIRAGQFKAPFNGETLLGDGVQPFVSRSVATSGYYPPEAYGPRAGITLDRQLGLQLHSARLGADDGVGFKYMVGIFNGNGMNQLFNDNNSVAPAGRLELDFMKKVTVGANAFYNLRADGTRPNRVGINDFGFGGDVALNISGFTALAQLVGKNSTYAAAGLNPELALGVTGSVHYFHEGTGLEAGVRYSFFEPSNAQVDDVVHEVSALIGWRLRQAPLRVVLQYTHRSEEVAVSLANDSLDLMLQATW
jgi:hypothetical protein